MRYYFNSQTVLWKNDVQPIYTYPIFLATNRPGTDTSSIVTTSDFPELYYAYRICTRFACASSTTQRSKGSVFVAHVSGSQRTSSSQSSAKTDAPGGYLQCTQRAMSELRFELLMRCSNSDLNLPLQCTKNAEPRKQRDAPLPCVRCFIPYTAKRLHFA